ncbi:MAG: hypothetical protein AABY22_35005, partial [Nanoarchaeota archaeon]
MTILKTGESIQYADPSINLFGNRDVSIILKGNNKMSWNEKETSLMIHTGDEHLNFLSWCKNILFTQNIPSTSFSVEGRIGKKIAEKFLSSVITDDLKLMREQKSIEKGNDFWRKTFIAKETCLCVDYYFNDKIFRINGTTSNLALCDEIKTFCHKHIKREKITKKYS